jgi:hypothetical protein
MTWTWQEMMRLALFRSGLVGRAQIAGANQYKEAKDTLGTLLDELDGAGMALPVIDSTIIFNTVANTPKYTFGAGGTGFAVRPETILVGMVRLASAPDQFQEMAPMPFLQYSRLPIPSTLARPFNYAWNEAWPLGELYLYPTPDSIYQITLYSKVKWSDTVGDPDTNYFVTGQIPSGYANAIIDLLSEKLAKNNRLGTDELTHNAYNARFLLTAMVQDQLPPVSPSRPRGVFGYDIIRAGVNP